jgi:hypothetical protein
MPQFLLIKGHEKLDNIPNHIKNIYVLSIFNDKNKVEQFKENNSNKNIIIKYVNRYEKYFKIINNVKNELLKEFNDVEILLLNELKQRGNIITDSQKEIEKKYEKPSDVESYNKPYNNRINDKININSKEYHLEIEYRDIKNSYASIKGNKVIIRVSNKLCEHKQQEVISSLIKKLRNYKPSKFKRIKEEYKEYKNGDVIEFDNKKFKIDIEYFDKTSSSAVIRGNTIYLRISSKLNEESKKKHIAELVRKVISKKRLPKLKRVIKELNEKYFNVSYKNIMWKKQLSRWGSCSANGNINISHRLLFAPEDVLEYVCIHEITHLKVFNHSQEFWNLIAKAIPDYKEKIEWLEEHGGSL